MFNKIKSFFSKPKEEEQDNSIAKVSFVISEGDETPTLDIVIADYSEETIDALVKVLFTIQSPTCMLETLNVIIDNLRQNDQDQAAILLCVKLGNDFLTAMPQPFVTNALKETPTKESNSEEPCIKPSDMLQ
jgi:antitoxin component HigA of HigAB toxin-antitoxin module